MSSRFRNLSAAISALPASARNKTALVAVSGGRDSVTLLHLLVLGGWKKLIVVHLNHGLRGRSSDADAKFVRQLAARYGLKCEIRKSHVARLAKKEKVSVETAGREARREFFTAMARKHRCKILFTAHQADDQAETVLHRLCRGTSLAGAAGMLPSSDTLKGVKTLRPLLGVTRAEIDEYLSAHKLAFREDASNASPLHTRNRVRHELLPLMKDVFGRDVSPLLLRFAELARRDDAWLQEEAARFSEQHALVQQDGSLRVTGKLKKLHPALQSRILFHWLSRTHRIPTGTREIESALTMLRGNGSGRINPNLPHGSRLCGDGRRLWVKREPEPPHAATKDCLPRPPPSRKTR